MRRNSFPQRCPLRAFETPGQFPSLLPQTKYIDETNVLEKEIDPQKQRIELLGKNNFDKEKKDMWDD